MKKLWCVYIYISLLLGVEYSLCRGISNDEWDILTFSQSWPLAFCQRWKEGNKENTCSLPPLKEKWTIHGLWPTKLGTTGPSNCNPSLIFNEEKIRNIETELNQYWPDIRNGTTKYAFWKYEWEKHGTCAVSLKELDSEEKYFQQVIKWAQKYDMSDILYQTCLKPGATGVFAQTIAESVRNALGVNPYLLCYNDKESNDVYLQEIRICFDKRLKLVNCDGTKDLDTGVLLSNCQDGEPIIYLSKAPPKESGYLTALMFIIFLQWLTR